MIPLLRAAFAFAFLAIFYWAAVLAALLSLEFHYQGNLSYAAIALLFTSLFLLIALGIFYRILNKAAHSSRRGPSCPTSRPPT